MLDINKFKLVQIKPSIMVSDSYYHDVAFLNWHKIWNDSYKFFGWDASVYSDAWSRQDTVTALFYEDEFVGSCSFKSYDMKCKLTSKDSYI
jgi:hypothetical protein